MYAQEMARERDSEKMKAITEASECLNMPCGKHWAMAYGWISVSFGAGLIGIADAGSLKERVGT